MFEKLVPLFQDQFNAIQLCLNKEHYLAATMLLYSTIDTLANLDMPEDSNRVTANDFKNWCEKYIIPSLNFKGSKEDLWGARCGILHTAMAESDLSKNGTSKEIWYFLDKISPEIEKIAREHPNGHDFLTLDLRIFLKALQEGTCNFFICIKADEKKIELVKNRARRLLTTGSFSVTDHLTA